MSLPNTAHTSRPWRIHELTHDFRLEDVRASVDTQNQRGAGRRDVDLGGGLHACRRDGQRLECRETTAGDRAGLAGVVAPAH